MSFVLIALILSFFNEVNGKKIKQIEYKTTIMLTIAYTMTNEKIKTNSFPR